MPVSAWLFGLLTVNVNEVLPFSGIVATPKALVTVGAAVTVRFAVAVPPVPALVDVTAPVVLVQLPAEAPATFTLKVHEPLAGMVPPDKLTLLDPATAAIVPLPHEPLRPLGVATTIPLGNASVNATPLSATVLTWATVKLRLVVPFIGIRATPNVLVIEGGASTITLADAVPPVPPSTDVTAPVVLFCTPATVPVTFTLNVHDPLAATVAPVRLTLLPPAVAAIVPPPHDPVRPFGVATAMPAGNVSVKPTPLSATAFGAGFVTVKLRLVVPFRGIVGAPNVLVIDGGAITERLADPVPPLPPSFDVTAPVALFCTPAAVPATFTLKVHDAPAASAAPVRLTLPDPTAAAIVPPPQAPLNPLGAAICRPAGRVSLNPIPVSAWLALGLLTVKLKEVAPYSGIVAAPNVSVIPGGETTVSVALAVLPFPPLAEVTAAVVLVMLPPDVPFTFTLKVHEPFAPMLPPDKLTLLAPAVAVMVPPPHVPVRPFGVATARPAGNVSVNPTPPSARALAAGFVMVKLKLVVPLNGIAAAPNDLLIEGGNSTVILAEAVPPVPPSTDATAPVVLFCIPEAVPLTFTLNVHDPLTFTAAPVRLTLLPPAVAAIVPPPHAPVRPFGVATAIPAGNVSVKPTPVSAMAFAAGFAMVKLRLVVPFRATVGAPKVLVIVGGMATVTVEVSLIVPAPASLEVMGPVVLD